MNKVLNFLFGAAIIILIGTVIRTLIYLLIGLQTDRIFRYDLMIIWGICTLIILFKTISKRFNK